MILPQKNPKKTPKKPKSFVCICGKSYKHDSSYYKHKKTCKNCIKIILMIIIYIQKVLKENLHKFAYFSSKSFFKKPEMDIYKCPNFNNGSKSSKKKYVNFGWP